MGQLKCSIQHSLIALPSYVTYKKAVQPCVPYSDLSCIRLVPPTSSLRGVAADRGLISRSRCSCSLHKSMRCPYARPSIFHLTSTSLPPLAPRACWAKRRTSFASARAPTVLQNITVCSCLHLDHGGRKACEGARALVSRCDTANPPRLANFRE
jgi:hypothetical protein